MGAQGHCTLHDVGFTGVGVGTGQREGGVAHLAQAAVTADGAGKRQVVAVDFEQSSGAQAQCGHACAGALHHRQQALAFAVQIETGPGVDGQGRGDAEGLVDAQTQRAGLDRGGTGVCAVARQGEDTCTGLDQAAKVKQGAAEIGAARAVVGACSEVVDADGQP